MDPEVRSKGPGKCSKCGMALEAGIPHPIEYPVEVRATPSRFRPGQKMELAIRVFDPAKGEPVRRFLVIHEKLFHAFLIGDDLEFFAHEHPVLGSDGVFRLRIAIPKPGAYRLLCDFYPEGGAPQMIPRTLIFGDYRREIPKLAADLSPKRSVNLEAVLETEPAQPIAGKKTLLFFKLSPAEGLEPLLGAWGHLLAASDDLLDTIHTHPFLADGGPQVQFNMFFPREATYRLWVQFQRKGQVNTMAFTVPVSRLR